MATLSRYLRCTGAHITFIAETRCSVEMAKKRIRELPPCNYAIVPSRGNSGGLWLLWDSSIQIAIIEEGQNLIVARVPQMGDKQPWLLVAVYGDPHRRTNPEIWSQIEQHIESHDLPVCILGDFNAILDTSEKTGGSQTLSAANRGFRTWVHGNGLLDLGHHGPAYTWSNKQGGGAHISSRLDRVLANIEWTMMYPNAAVFHLPRFNSDHLPVLLKTDAKKVRLRPNFRCENWWSFRPEFKNVCKEAAVRGGDDWEGLKKSFKVEVKKWGIQNKSPDTMLAEVEKKMEFLMHQDVTDETLKREKELEHEHARILLMRERYWHQRSRVAWALFGDKNSKFYHASAVTRKKRNEIRAVMISDGIWATEEKDIRRAFLDHFKEIYKGIPTQPIQNCYPMQLLLQMPKISDQMRSALEEIPSTLEITTALNAIGPYKAAGPDGFDAKTVQDNWCDFGPAVTKVVL